MAIKFIRSSREVTRDTEQRDAYIQELLISTVNGLHRVEKQLERLTEETIDNDEETLIE
jgi:hypothetical protein